MKIFVQRFECKQMTLEVEKYYTIATIMDMIEREVGLPTCEQRLIFEGKTLKDEDTLADHDIRDGSELYLTVRLRGGGGGMFVDMENMSSLRTRRGGCKTAPRWRYYEAGLNIYGTCTNRLCEAYNQRVIRPKGFVVFNLNKNKRHHCPACHKPFKATTCSFSNCVWMFEGQKALSAPNYIVSPWRTVAKGVREYYDDHSDNMVEWSSLIIIAKPRPPVSESIHSHKLA